MTFALITEGISEHRIVKHILQKFFKEHDPEINQIQPKIDGNKQATIGSWNEVLKYCTLEKELSNIFTYNDYLIIQIDTDESQNPSFDVSPVKTDNEEKAVAELCDDVISKLISLLPAKIFQTFSERILFAICVHTIECWLLPIYYSNNHRSATKGCITKLNAELRRNNLDNIPTTTKDKNSAIAIRTYEVILKNWKRKQDILADAQHNAGFSQFITMLESINPSSG